MTGVESVLVCDGCGAQISQLERRPFRCPHAASGDDVDHVLRRRLRVDPVAAERLGWAFADREPNPFLRYRELLHSYSAMLSRGGDDELFRSVVQDLDRRVQEFAGVGFQETPFERSPALAATVGCEDVWIKDETGNVGGTHKGRHLAGLLIWLQLDRQLATGEADLPRLAISSCGNAALAAALLARSVDRPIDVYVPTDAHPPVLDRLAALEAAVTRCERRVGERGDPPYLRFVDALEDGALPFTCQGPQNGLVIEGGQTLIWEIASRLLADGRQLDRLFVQSGGGALASACVLGWREAAAVTPLGPLPRIHAVQTSGAWPLVRAYDLLVARLARRHLSLEPKARLSNGERTELAERIRREVEPSEVERELRYAAAHRSEFMWPWEEQPQSIADAILDDETYDWLPVVSGMLESGGYPLVVSEERIREAHEMAREVAAIGTCATGSTGLAGALELGARGALAGDETVGLLFTGRG